MYVPFGQGIAYFPDLKELAQRKKYNLLGTVVNSVTGEGLPRAVVTVNNQVVTMADGSGNFVFEGIAAGNYYLSARKPGYFTRGEANEGDGTFQSLVEVGPETHSITLKLLPESVVFGHVTDSDGLPVRRLPVQCLRLMYVEGRKQWIPAGNSTTDEDGYYRMAGLTPGTYLVVAGPSEIPSLGAMAKTAQQNAGYSAAYFPGPVDNNTASGITINPGQLLEANLSVEAERFYTVSGSMNLPPGASGWVRLVATGAARQERGGVGMRGEGGTFMLRMTPPGDYILLGQAQVEGRMWNGSMPLHVAGDMTGVQLPVEPGISIIVNFDVRRTQAAPAELPIGGRMSGRMRMPILVSLQSTDQYARQFGAAPLPSDPSTFAFQNVEPGTYQVNFVPMGDLYVASARYGSTDVLREKLVLTRGGQGSLDVVLRDDGGSLKGNITSDGKPAHGVVLIVPEHRAAYISRGARDASDFSLSELQPGSYSILAFDSLYDLEYSNPEALEPYMSEATHADVSAKQETTVKVE
ncbi:MAG: MSCRAMM family protein, partial [Terriglobales bacterium]